MNSDLLPKAGLALDVAAGLAQHGLFLARHGLKVIALDIADAGLKMAMKLARQERLNFEGVICDIEHVGIPSDFFDVIINMMFLKRSCFVTYRRTLKPGGLLFFESLLDKDATLESHYLRPGEVHDAFADYSILYEGGRTFVNSHEGVRKDTCQLIARKPMG
jgi:SAM-dependent methyltransferase